MRVAGLTVNQSIETSGQFLAPHILLSPSSQFGQRDSDSYSAPVGVRSIVINLSVSLCICLSVHEHKGTAGLIFTKFFVQLSCGHGLVRDTLCTSGFMDDVRFGHNGPYSDSGVAIPGQSLMSTNALFAVGKVKGSCLPLGVHVLAFLSCI